MKLRLGFVSNSSSSSFVAWGISLEEDEMLEICDKRFPDENNAGIGRYELAEVLTAGSNIDYNVEEYTSTAEFGKCPFQIKEDQTLKEYKQEIVAELKKLGIETTIDKLHQIEECSYDG